MRMLDLFSGTAADMRVDLATWNPSGYSFDLVWASPPCTQLSTASTKRDVGAGMVLVRAALEEDENVRSPTSRAARRDPLGDLRWARARV